MTIESLRELMSNATAGPIPDIRLPLYATDDHPPAAPTEAEVLRGKVVEAAKAWDCDMGTTGPDKALSRAVRALLAAEAAQRAAGGGE